MLKSNYKLTGSIRLLRHKVSPLTKGKNGTVTFLPLVSLSFPTALHSQIFSYKRAIVIWLKAE